MKASLNSLMNAFFSRTVSVYVMHLCHVLSVPNENKKQSSILTSRARKDCWKNENISSLTGLYLQKGVKAISRPYCSSIWNFVSCFTLMKYSNPQYTPN